MTIFEKLVAACDRTSPGLFFWHMEAVYARLLVSLCSDFEEYGMPVMDTTTSLFQNEELIAVATKAINRKKAGNLLGIDYWEYYVNEKTLQKVIEFLSNRSFPKSIDFHRPTQLLALVFCEGFFGEIEKEKIDGDSRSSFLGDLTDDSPASNQAEKLLREFLDGVDFSSVVSSVSEDVDILKRVRDQLRTMLMEDALDKADELKRLGEQFVMRNNAGRNTLLRGLPRFLRVMYSCIGDS